MSQRHTLWMIRRQDGSARVVLPLRTWLTLSHLTVFLLPILVLIGSGALALDLRNQTVWDLEHQGAILSILVTNQLKFARQNQPGATLESIGPSLSANLRATKEATLAGIRITNRRGVVEDRRRRGAGVWIGIGAHPGASEGLKFGVVH